MGQSQSASVRPISSDNGACSTAATAAPDTQEYDPTNIDDLFPMLVDSQTADSQQQDLDTLSYDDADYGESQPFGGGETDSLPRTSESSVSVYRHNSTPAATTKLRSTVTDIEIMSSDSDAD